MIQTHTSGRPKRTASCSMMERRQLKKRKKQKLDSDDSAGDCCISMVTIVSNFIDEYCPGNHNESSDDSCSSGVDVTVVNSNHPSEDSSEECMEVTPSRKTTLSSNSTPRRPNGISKKRKSPVALTPSQLNCSVNVSDMTSNILYSTFTIYRYIAIFITAIQYNAPNEEYQYIRAEINIQIVRKGIRLVSLVFEYLKSIRIYNERFFCINSS